MPMPMWFIPVFIVLALLSFLITPPTFIVNWFTSRFTTHTRLSTRDSVYLSANKLTGNEQDMFIHCWNAAEFLYETDEMPPNEAIGYRVTVIRGRREYRYLLHVSDAHIDVFRNASGQRRLAYRVVAPELADCIIDLSLRGLAATGY